MAHLHARHEPRPKLGALAGCLGRTALLRLPPFRIAVRVLGIRTAWGRVDYLVTPVLGEQSAWVSGERLAWENGQDHE